MFAHGESLCEYLEVTNSTWNKVYITLVEDSGIFVRVIRVMLKFISEWGRIY